MSRRSPFRPLALVCVLTLTAVWAAGCGGGAAGTPNDDDLIVTYFNMGGRTDVYRNQPLELRFSAPVKAETLSDRTIRVLTGPDLKIPVRGALIQISDNVVIFDPTRSQGRVNQDGGSSPQDQPFGFAALSNHQIFVPGPPLLKTLTNRAGDTIRAGFFASFTTSEEYLPELVQPKYIGVDGKGALGFSPPPRSGGVLDPVLGQTEVPHDAQIIFRFSEPIAPETIDPSSTLKVQNLDETEPIVGGPLRVPGTIRASNDGMTYTFVPSFSYGPGVTQKDSWGNAILDPVTGLPIVLRGFDMRVTLTQGITDLAGNPLEAPVEKFFRTEKAPDQVVTKVISETFNSFTYWDPQLTTADWNTAAPGKLRGGSITTTILQVMVPADGVNSRRGGAGNAAWRAVDYPLVSSLGSAFCPSWLNGIRLQCSYTSEEMGDPGAVTEVFWGPSSNALFAATHDDLKIRIGHTKDAAGNLSSTFDDNFLGGVPLPAYEGIYDVPARGDIDPPNPQVAFWPYPTLATPFEYGGDLGVVFDYLVTPANDCQYLRYWFYGLGAGFPGYPGIRNIIARDPTSENDDFTGGGQPLILDLQLTKKRRTTLAQSKFYNTQSPVPDYGDPIISPSSQPGGATFVLEWRGATDKANSLTYTGWGPIHIADGKQYIQFRAQLISNLNSNTLARFDEIRIPYVTR